MAATKNVDRLFHDVHVRIPDQVPIAASTQYFQGAAGFVDAVTGLLTKIVNSGANPLAGIITRHQDSLSSVDLTNTLKVEFNHVEEFTLSGVTIANRRAKVFLSDDNTLSLDPANKTYLGIIVSISGTDRCMVHVLGTNI